MILYGLYAQWTLLINLCEISNALRSECLLHTLEAIKKVLSHNQGY